MLTSLFYRKVLSKSLPDIKILFLRLRNFEKQIRSNKKWKARCHKAFHIRRAPLFDKIVRKAGLIHYGASGDTAFFKKHSNINGFRTPEQRNYLYSALLKQSISAAIARFISR